MLYTEEAVRAGLRVRDGRRVFYPRCSMPSIAA